MDKRKTRELETGKLIPYRWGAGWTVVPRVGGNYRAKCYGLGIAPDIAEGQRRLDHLAANEDDGWKGFPTPWSPPARCVYVEA